MCFCCECIHSREADKEISVKRLPRHIPHRIIPCYIDMIPVTMYFNHVPCMIDVSTRYYGTRDSRLLEEIKHGFCIPLTYRTVFYKSSIHIIFILFSKSICQIRFIRICNCRRQILMISKHYFLVSHSAYVYFAG